MRELSLVAAVLLTFTIAAPAQNKGEEKEAQGASARQSKLEGLLIDAGCRDRTVWNMKRAPESQQAAVPPAGQGAQAPNHGITVDPATLDAERSDVSELLMHSDSNIRQSDPTCAIKGNTRAFALLLPNGRLLDLDEGGNTFAAAMVSANPQGRAMLNGQGPGFKPRVRITGSIEGDRLLTEELNVLH